MKLPTPALERAPRPATGRRLPRSGWAWGALCLAAATAWASATADPGLPAIILALVGGWLCASAFANAALRADPAWRGAVAHVLGAVLGSGAVALAATRGKALLPDASDGVAAVGLTLYVAALPAVGWLWLTLFARISARAAVPVRARPPAPAWEVEGATSAVRFDAIPLRMAGLAVQIVTAVVIGGAGTAVLVILLDEAVPWMGARLLIILVGLLCALPVYAALTMWNQWHTVPCEAVFGGDRMTLVLGGERREIAYREMHELVWRTTSDYARVVVRGAGIDVSLIVGLARGRRDVSPELPPLPERTLRSLGAAGLDPATSRRPGLTVFRRA